MSTWLLAFCLVGANVSAQNAAPEFVSKLTAVAPFPALVSAAKANHIPLEQIDPLVKTKVIGPGDSFTAVIALFPKRSERMQWRITAR